MNQNYETVDYVQTGNVPESDLHESFVIDEGESALLTAYSLLQYEISSYNVSADPQWLVEGVFQEVNISSGEVTLEGILSTTFPFLRAMFDLVILKSPVIESLQSRAGIMSVLTPSDKSPATRRYQVSARHVSAIYCMDGSDGSII